MEMVVEPNPVWVARRNTLAPWLCLNDLLQEPETVSVFTVADTMVYETLADELDVTLYSTRGKFSLEQEKSSKTLKKTINNTLFLIACVFYLVSCFKSAIKLPLSVLIEIGRYPFAHASFKRFSNFCVDSTAFFLKNDVFQS
jgi:hypothetical protein